MVDKIKVLSVCTSDSVGGAARAAYRIHLAVREYGIDSKMFVKNKRTEDSNVIPLKHFIPDSLFYRAFDWIRNKIKNKWQHFQWRKYPHKSQYYMSDMRSTDICGALRKLDYDILHLHWVNLRFLPLDCLPKDKPIVWTLHDSWAFCGLCHSFLDCERYQNECGYCPQLGSNFLNDLSHILWQKKNRLYKDLDLHIVCPSEWLGNSTRRSSLLGRFPISVIPNCLDTKVFRPLLKKELSTRWLSFMDKRIVLFGAMSATKDRIKGFSYLLFALQFLEDQDCCKDYEFVVFGATDSDFSLNISTPIHYVGPITQVEDLVSLYNLASVMVVPSLTEVFGQTASESLACGTPVVAFQCTGIQEVVEHKKNGYLATPYVSEDLAIGIKWCLNNNTDGQLSKNARKKVIENYTQGMIGRKYADLYTDIIANHH